MESRLKFVFTNRDGSATCDIADEVDRLFGFGVTVVSVGWNTLYIDTRYPTWAAAYAYARELYAAACEGRDAYQQALRN